MKTKPEQLAALLGKKSNQVYLVTGNETLIIEECCDLIRAKLKADGFDEREVLHVEAGFKWEYLLECANALSLFADKRLIEIRLGSQKINKAASKILLEYLTFAPPENTLLLIGDKLDGAAKKSAWYKKIDQQGCIVEVWPIETQQLPNWLKKRAAAQNLQLEDEAIAVLCDRIEGNLLAAKQEIDKLLLLQKNTPLSAADIINAVSDSSRYDVFALMDAIVLGDSTRSLKILQVLRQEALEPTIILWAISRELRLLHELKTGLNQGKSYESLCGSLRVWGKKKQTLQQAAMRLNFEQLEALLHQCATVDQIIKGMQIGDYWLEITDMTLALSGRGLKLS